MLFNRLFGNFDDVISSTAANVPGSTNMLTYNFLEVSGFDENIAQVFLKKKMF